MEVGSGREGRTKKAEPAREGVEKERPRGDRARILYSATRVYWRVSCFFFSQAKSVP